MNIIKILKNTKSETLWMGFYNSEGSLILENIYLNIDMCESLFGKCKILNICDDSYDIRKHFKPVEDFEYLLDFSPIEKGNNIYTFDGILTIKNYKEITRPPGYYNYYYWTFIDKQLYYKITQVHYEEHNVFEFTVNENDNTYIYEDYNYQQTYIKDYLQQMKL